MYGYQRLCLNALQKRSFSSWMARVFCVCGHEVGGKTLIQHSALSIIRGGPECPDWIGRVLGKVGKGAVDLATVLPAVIGTELALMRLFLRRVKCRSVR